MATRKSLPLGYFLLAACVWLSLQAAGLTQDADPGEQKKIGVIDGKPLYLGKTLGPKDLYAVRQDADPDKALEAWNAMLGSIRAIGTCDVLVLYRSSSTATHVDEMIVDRAKIDAPVYIGRCQLNFDLDMYRWDWWRTPYQGAKEFQELDGALNACASGKCQSIEAENMVHTAYILTPDYTVDRVRNRTTVRLPGNKYAEWPAAVDIRLAGWVKPAQLRFPTSFPQWINAIQVAYQPFAVERLDTDLVRISWFRKASHDVQQYDVRPSQGFAVCGIRHSTGATSNSVLHVKKDLKLDATLFREVVRGRRLVTRAVTKSDQGVEDFRFHWKSVNQPLDENLFDQRAFLRPGDVLTFSREYAAMLEIIKDSLENEE